MHYVPTEPELKHLGGNTIGGNAQTYYPELWFLLVQTFAIKTVLDVGCGEGHALREFKRLGCEAYGIDGAPHNVSLAVASGLDKVVVHDLTKAPYVAPAPIDLVWTCEVLQQIEERFVDNVLATLAQGRRIAMTHGLPGQQGHHMVNNQPVEYWRERLEKRGFVVERDFMNSITNRRLGRHYWAATGMIYRRSNNDA